MSRKGKADEVPNMLPCPFCGSSEHLVIEFWAGWSVDCDTCNVSGPAPLSAHNQEAKEAAIRKWNARATTPAVISSRLLEVASQVSDFAEDMRALAGGQP